MTSKLSNRGPAEGGPNTTFSSSSGSPFATSRKQISPNARTVVIEVVQTRKDSQRTGERLLIAALAEPSVDVRSVAWDGSGLRISGSAASAAQVRLFLDRLGSELGTSGLEFEMTSVDGDVTFEIVGGSELTREIVTWTAPPVEGA